MSHFDQLHPALQHHIVNSFRWRELRPFQDAVIPSILSGKHLIILAPTAGGKTEAALFPVLSRLLSENWTGLSVLYICPIKALLNNLDTRLDRYCSLLGRRSALWHGDVTTAARRHVLRDPPDCMLTTPESLELMLVSPNVDAHTLFSPLRVVIVDEIHAFAGDDRGWHLLAVLERITRLAGKELQRIGLSATVGNPDALIDWLAGSCKGERTVFVPSESVDSQAEVKLDYVGSLSNAATVISRLHRGEKRLVFLDSRARAEVLGADLRKLSVTTFVTHSSLSQDQRRQAEDPFTNRDDCVIVATSVLELGIDVGNLDRVIQIDSPGKVSSFLQRMGRTGRRAGTPRNCLFLATRDETLMQAAALIDLWTEGYIEPIEPPVEPYHILAQQFMALALQEKGIGLRTWFDWVKGVPAFEQMPARSIEGVVEWMLQREIIWEDQGIAGIGRGGEEAYGRRHFMELLSVFTSPPLFQVLHGREEVGFVDELTFLRKRDSQHVLLLGGRAWGVTHIDWQRRVAYVTASDEKGMSRWRGEGQSLGFRLCQAIKSALVSEQTRDWWSRRTCDQMGELRREFAWLTHDNSTVLFDQSGKCAWWTFAGRRANTTLASAFTDAHLSATADNLAVRFEQLVSVPVIDRAFQDMRSREASSLLTAVDETAVDGLKFSECLPPDLAKRVLEMRNRDDAGVERVLRAPIRIVSE